MPLPKPELPREVQRMFAGGVEEFVGRERHRCGVKDSARNADERNNEDEFEWIDDVVA